MKPNNLEINENKLQIQELTIQIDSDNIDKTTIPKPGGHTYNPLVQNTKKESQVSQNMEKIA